MGRKGLCPQRLGTWEVGLEAAELLMGLRHGGRGGGVDAGAVTVTGGGGTWVREPFHPGWACRFRAARL